MYTGPYADNQLTTESFHTEPVVLTIPHAASQNVFQVPHFSNLETPGAMFHHYSDEYEYAHEYDEENEGDGDDNGTRRRQ
jgi:hypothetical protein